MKILAKVQFTKVEAEHIKFKLDAGVRFTESSVGLRPSFLRQFRSCLTGH